MLNELGMTQEEFDKCSVQELQRRLLVAEQNAKKLKYAAEDQVTHLQLALQKKKRPVVTFDEFASRMDCKYVSGNIEVGPNYWISGFVFANGAFSDGHRHQGPSKNKFHLAKMKLQFLRLQARALKQEFEAIRKNVYALASMQVYAGDTQKLPTPGEEQVEALEELQRKIQLLQRKMEPLHKILAQSPEAKELRQRQAAKRAADLEIRDLLARANQIEV